MIIETDKLEQDMEAGSTYADCFKRINIRRTEISVGVYAIQVLCGIYLVGYATYFFTLAGLPTEDSFDMGVGFLACGFVGTCLSWILLIHVGRRRIYLGGLAMLALLQFIIAILDCAPDYDSNKSFSWAQAVLMLIWNFIYGWSVGPICFVIICEASATRVRSKTIGVATAAQATLGIVMTVAIPYMINPDQANLRGKLGFFFGGLAAISWVWAYFRVPEFKGRSSSQREVTLLTQSQDVLTRSWTQCLSAVCAPGNSRSMFSSDRAKTRAIGVMRDDETCGTVHAEAPYTGACTRRQVRWSSMTHEPSISTDWMRDRASILRWKRHP